MDYENVQGIDLTVIGSRAVRFTLLLGPQQTKLDVSVVEKLMEHTAATRLVRLTSAGRNALDFTLAYYVGQAVAADPTGHFYIVSKDKGYDPLIAHLHSKQIHARRHDDFVTLPFAGSAKPSTPTPAAPQSVSSVPALKPKPPAKPKVPSATWEDRTNQVLEHLRKGSSNRPKNRHKLVSCVIAHLGHQITEAGALTLIGYLVQGGHLAINEHDAVTYSLPSR